MTVGEMIVSIRKEKGLTQKELAEKLNISPAMVNQYEKNKRNPKKETLQKIADALDINVLTLAFPFIDEFRDLKKDANVRVLRLTPEDKKHMDFLEAYTRLNDDGKEAIFKYMDLLIGNEKYIAEKAADPFEFSLYLCDIFNPDNFVMVRQKCSDIKKEEE